MTKSIHHYSVIEGKENGLRPYSCYGEDPFSQGAFSEAQALSLASPLANIYEEKPFSCIYLLNLFIAPDMKRYLKETSIPDDVYNLPVHLQRVVCDASTELLVSKEETACHRLYKLKNYIDTVSHHDTACIIDTLNELVHDEDELINILGE